MLRSAFFWDVKQLGVLIRYQRFGKPTSHHQRGKKCTDFWTSCVKSQTSANFVYVVAETWNHDCVLFKAGLGRPLGVLEVEAPRICRQSAHEVGKVVSHTHVTPLMRYFGCSLLLKAQSTPRPQCLWHSASTNCATACPVFYAESGILRQVTGIVWYLAWNSWFYGNYCTISTVSSHKAAVYGH